MLEEITEPLLDWYAKNRRTLPWRERRDPYEIWVSEIMLQQTRVEAVKPFYERFMTALPTVGDLAVCPEDRLLKLWEGLGYYNRVRNMQKAAMIVTEQYGGVLPAENQALRSLPGIGSYTAGAIASIAYGMPVPAVDGNVLRILSRLREDDSDIMKQSLRKQVEKELTEVIPSERPGDFNQALMDLGATICLPNGAPRCGECPLYRQCLAGQHESWQQYPVKKKQKARRIEEKTVFLLLDGTHAGVRRRPKRGLLAGLYEFPNVPGWLDEEEALETVREFGLSPLRIQKLPEAKHIFSHVEWHMKGYAVRVEEPGRDAAPDLIFADVEETGERYAVPAAFAAYAGYVDLKLGQEKYNTEK